MPSSKDNVPLFKVLVDGGEIDPGEANFVQDITITDFLRLPDVCTVAVGYPPAENGNPFQPLDDSAFKIGARLEVKMGSIDESTTETLFKGEVATVEPDFQAGSVRMVVRAYDKSHRMMRTRKQRAFTNQTVSDIVAKICGEYGLSADTESSGDPLEYVIQHNETDWDFIWRHATRLGMEFVVLDESRARLAKPGESSPEVELRYPDDLQSFQPRVTAVQQMDTVNVRGFDFKSKRQVVSTSESPHQVTQAGIERDDVTGKFGETTLEIAGQSFRTSSEADAIAQAQLDQFANAYLAAVGACFGNPKIKAGVKLKISGVGANYSGTYYVAKVKHTIRTGGAYMTAFSNSPGEQTLIGQVGANGGGGRIDSLIVGIVTNNNDPDQLGRVKVKLPALSDQESFWAPVAVPAAGNERGLSMLPVPDEQVIVGFENGDPSYPIVLGSVFNGKDKPGDELAVSDGSFALKSDHEALVAAKEDITLRSDGGKWVIEIDGGEITETVKAGQGGQGGYTGTFDGQFGVTATQAVQIESKLQVTIKAPQISIQAQGPLQIQGNPVQIDGGSAVTISGGMINLG
jgi:uncharacterized protein involved in type VI secretion and phage assembly